MNKYYASFGLAVVASSLAVTSVFAETSSGAPHGNGMWNGGNHRPGMARAIAMRPAIVGKITAINGSTLTVSKNERGATSSGQQTAFSVNASSATVMKGNATSTLSSLAVGDTVFVEGTTTGNTVIATMIRDGQMMRGGRFDGQDKPRDLNGFAPQLQGNGEPVVAGSVTVINGNTLTITNKSNVTYAVDISNAKILTGNSTSTSGTSSIQVGDSVVVQGVVNGTQITASTVIRNAGKGAMGTSSSSGAPSQGPKRFMSIIGGFFSHLFGF